MKRIFIMGATSGIGLHLALIYISRGYIVGVAGRRENELETLRKAFPDKVFAQSLDVTKENATFLAQSLVDKMGGMDVYIHCSGIGYRNISLQEKLELDTVDVNCLGFTQMIDWATNFFEKQNHGHIVAISSIAGTKGLAPAPAYSASKAYQQKYLQAISQRQKILKNKIMVTDIRPGFVNTELLKSANYPMTMNVEDVAFEIFGAIRRRNRIKIIDFRYKILVMLWKMLPNSIYENIPLKMD